MEHFSETHDQKINRYINLLEVSGFMLFLSDKYKRYTEFNLFSKDQILKIIIEDIYTYILRYDSDINLDISFEIANELISGLFSN